MIIDGTTYTIHIIPYSFFSFSFLTILSIIYPWLIGFDLHMSASTTLSLLYILLHCYSCHIVFFALVSFLFPPFLFSAPLLILCRCEKILACGPDTSTHSFFFSPYSWCESFVYNIYLSIGFESKKLLNKFVKLNG